MNSIDFNLKKAESFMVSTSPFPPRRFVTAEDAEGRSYFVADGPAPNTTTEAGVPKASVIWATGDAAAPGPDPAPAGHSFGFHSPKGTVFRIVEFPPDAQYDHARLAKFIDEHGVHASGPPPVPVGSARL